MTSPERTRIGGTPSSGKGPRLRVARYSSCTAFWARLTAVNREEASELRASFSTCSAALTPTAGADHPSESSGKSEVASSGAAVDAELAIVIDAWANLTLDLRSVIVGIVRKPAADGHSYDEC